MIAHAAFPNLDLQERDRNGKLLPSSLSPAIISKLLRDELEFEGLVLTDDLEMGAISRHCEIEDAAVRAAKAGEDMLLICASPDKIQRGYRALLAAAKNGRLPETRIKQSLNRIAQTKAIIQPPLPLDLARFQQLADEVLQLNAKLNYVYGGPVK